MPTIPPIEQCEICFVPNRRSPIILWANSDSFETLEQAVRKFMQTNQVKFIDIRWVHGEEKQRMYNAFQSAAADDKIQFHDCEGKE